MYSDWKNTTKAVLYKFQPDNLLSACNLKLGYIFHTEKIYEDAIFNQLINFCLRYKTLTGTQPVSTIIPPTNLLIKKEMFVTGFNESQFIERVHQLSEHATIGYHGHFYLNNSESYINAIHCNSFNQSNLVTQFTDDLNWFESNQIEHNGIYAAGWWFMNEHLVNLLLDHGFKYDFSFSQARHFYNQYSSMMMTQQAIKPGERFFLSGSNGNQLLCVQNFIGMHSTPFPQDFVRNMKSLLGTPVDHRSIVGVVNSHDYDLDFDNTFRCLEYLLKHSDITWWSFEDIIRDINDIRVILAEDARLKINNHPTA